MHRNREPSVLDAARDVLERASNILICSGAGMSAESGVPTFRGSDGLWKQYRPEELATPGAFRRDPRLVWEWYDWRRQLVSTCRPHDGHRAVASAQAARRVRVVTQNVDGLHEKAASDLDAEATADRLLAVHGSLFRSTCTHCPYERRDRDPVDTRSEETLPRCPDCGHLLRPGVVWYGEPLDTRILARASQWAMASDACLVVGTSAVVEPAASLPRLVLEAGGTVIEVNLEPTLLTPLATYAIEGKASQLLPRLLDLGG